jgi:YidC/Oxa1 family membrane protein insertase
MDRQAWIAVTLCVLGLIAWQFYMTSHAPPLPPAPALASPAPGTPIALASPGSSPPTATVAPAPSAPPAVAETVPPFAERMDVLRNSDAELRLTNRGGAISEVVLLNHATDNGQRVILNSKDRAPIGALMANPATPLLPEYTMRREGDAVHLEHTTPENITIRKKFSFPKSIETKDNFIAEMVVDLQNRGSRPYLNTGYFVALGSIAPTHHNDYPTHTRLVWCIAGKAKGVDVGWFAGSGGFLGMGQHAPRPFYQENFQGAEWAAVSNQFFTTIITPLTAKANSAWGRSFEITRAPNQKVSAIEGAMGMPGFQLNPGETSSARFQIWAGPKIYNRLAQLEHNEAEIMNFGMLKIVCQFLLNFMNSLHSVLGNYAAAIFALTTIIKLILWPIQNKANRSMRRMAVLSPKMQELREKYKDDPTRMNQEVMKLYKDYGINPVSGCVPMLIQIPIFFGLFTMLQQAVELRNASFLWVKDLSQPDTIGHLPLLGWPINILPLIMAGTNVWLMQLTPKSGDATQQKVMMFMPLIFVVFCYYFAAALSLYYTIQNLFTILQLYQTRNQPLPVLEKVATANKKARKARR